MSVTRIQTTSLILCAFFMLASCSSSSSQGTNLIDMHQLEGFWLLKSLTKNVGDSTVTMTTNSAPLSVQGHIDVVASSSSAATSKSVTVYLDSNLIVDAELPKEVTNDLALEANSKLVVTADDDSQSVYV